MTREDFTLIEYVLEYVLNRLDRAMRHHYQRTEYRKSAPWGVS